MIIIRYSVKSYYFPKPKSCSWRRPRPGWRQRRTHTFLQGSPCRQHYLVFPKTPALRKGKPVKAALGGSFSYIICSFRNFTYRQIFKYSQLTSMHSNMKATLGIGKTACRLGVSRKDTAKESSLQPRLTFYSELRHNQVWDGDGLHRLFVLTRDWLFVCLRVTLLG